MAKIEPCPGCEEAHGFDEQLKHDPGRAWKHVRLVRPSDDDPDEDVSPLHPGYRPL